MIRKIIWITMFFLTASFAFAADYNSVFLHISSDLKDIIPDDSKLEVILNDGKNSIEAFKFLSQELLADEVSTYNEDNKFVMASIPLFKGIVYKVVYFHTISFDSNTGGEFVITFLENAFKYSHNSLKIRVEKDHINNWHFYTESGDRFTKLHFEVNYSFGLLSGIKQIKPSLE